MAKEATTAKPEALVCCAGGCEGAPLHPIYEASLRPPHSEGGAPLRMVVVEGACTVGSLRSFCQRTVCEL